MARRDRVLSVSEGLEGMKVAQLQSRCSSSLCEVAETVSAARLQNTSSWTGSESECRDAVWVGVLQQRRCGESPVRQLRE